MKRISFFEVIGSIALGLFVGCLINSITYQPIPPEPIDQQLESIDYSTYGGPRSGDWMQVRTDYVRKHPRCEACGTMANLNVHHVIPFHQRPDLELVEDNLITLCRDHHFRIGHDPDGKGPLKPSWLLSNPNVRSDAAAWKSRK